MTNINNWYGMSDPAILKEIGLQIKSHRLRKNFTQEALAAKAGVNRVTIGEIEKGRSSSLLTFVQVLRAIGKLEIFNHLLQENIISPIQFEKLEKKKRKRASSNKNIPPEKSSIW